MDQKSIILSFLLTYVNTTVNNSSITEANYNTQTRSFISNTVSRTNVIDANLVIMQPTRKNTNSQKAK
jgi:hypothetical protein